MVSLVAQQYVVAMSLVLELVVPLFLQKKVYVLNKYYLHFTEKYLSRHFFR
jgi:hypothetical protein